MRVKFARRQGQEVAINLTPLIDVVFLLLIFFMVATTFTKQTHLSIQLPEAGVQASEAVPAWIEVTVTRQGEYRVNFHSTNGSGGSEQRTNEIVLPDQKTSTLRAAIASLGNGNNALPMVVTADALASHQSVVRVMDVAGQLGFNKLALTTTPGAESTGMAPSDSAHPR